MSHFAPRRSRSNYIKRAPSGAYFYRRMIPLALQSDFGGKTEWWVPLSGRTDAERESEAMAHANNHNQQIRQMLDWREGRVPVVGPVARAFNWPEPSSAPAPTVWRDGALRTVPKLVVTGDPVVRREAEAKGVLVVSWDEFKLQEERAVLAREARSASTLEEQRLASRMLLGVQQEIEDEAKDSSPDCILNTMDRWFAHRKQHPETIRKHRQHIREFVDLHGDLPLDKVTLRMVSDFVDYVAGRVDENGRTLGTVSVAKRLDTMKALFRHAKKQGKIKTNPAEDAVAPHDDRTPGEMSYMPLTAMDCIKLLSTSSTFWTTRRQVGHPSRPFDLQVALRLLMATGARPNEICQLRRADVDLARRCITITDAPTNDNFVRRRVKNKWSPRVVPIHPSVWPIVVAHLSRSDHPLLFPSFAPNRSEGYYSDVLSGEWTDNLKGRLAFDHPKKVLDSLRHTFACEADRVEMPEAIKHEIMGHARGTNPNARRYIVNADSVDPKRLDRFREWVEKMQFPAPELAAPILLPEPLRLRRSRP